MFSSMFVLLLAGSMVSQMFSKPVLLVAFDSVNANFISDKMPDMDYIARPARLKSANPTLSFSTLQTVAIGSETDMHHVVANKMFDDDMTVMFNAFNQFYVNRYMKPIWIEAEKAGKKTATINWPGANILAHDTKPTFVEEYEYKTDADWKSRTEKIIKWFKDDGIEFGMAYFEDTNRMETVDSYIDRVQKVIKDIYNGLKDTDVDIIIMSNYGTKNVHKDQVLRIDDFLSEEDCHCNFIPAGPILFVRSNDIESLKSTYDKLTLRKEKKYTVYRGYDDYERDILLQYWNLKSFSNVPFTLIVIAFNGYTFYDQMKYDALNTSDVNIVRENGFDKNDPDMDGMLLLKGSSFKDNIVVEGAEIELREIHQLIKRLLDLKNEVIVWDERELNPNIMHSQKKEDRIKKSENKNKLSESMRKLIKDDILKIWDGKNWNTIIDITQELKKGTKNNTSSTTTEQQNQTLSVPKSKTEKMSPTSGRMTYGPFNPVNNPFKKTFVSSLS